MEIGRWNLSSPSILHLLPSLQRSSPGQVRQPPPLPGGITPHLAGHGGARADDAHVSLQDIEQLWNLVQGPVAQEAAHASDAGIVFGHFQPQALVLSADHHGAELVAAKGLAIFAHPLLDVEHRATVIELDGQGDEGHEGGENDQC